jgi:hypothetical protein
MQWPTWSIEHCNNHLFSRLQKRRIKILLYCPLHTQCLPSTESNLNQQSSIRMSKIISCKYVYVPIYFFLGHYLMCLLHSILHILGRCLFRISVIPMLASWRDSPSATKCWHTKAHTSILRTEFINVCSQTTICYKKFNHSMLTKWNINDTNFVAVVCGYITAGLVFQVGVFTTNHVIFFHNKLLPCCMIFMTFNTHYIYMQAVSGTCFTVCVRNPCLKHRHLCIPTEHCCKQTKVSAPQLCLHFHYTEVTQLVQ